MLVRFKRKNDRGISWTDHLSSFSTASQPHPDRASVTLRCSRHNRSAIATISVDRDLRAVQHTITSPTFARIAFATCMDPPLFKSSGSHDFCRTAAERTKVENDIFFTGSQRNAPVTNVDIVNHE